MLGMILLCVSLTSFIGSQEMQSGSIRGRIIDDTGQPLPGVSILISGPALLGKVTAVTNQEGMFRAPFLTPGSDYEIRAELAGFETTTQKGIIINVGKTISIEFQMKPSTIQHEVTITAPTPTVDVVKSSTSKTVTSDVLASLPLPLYFGGLVQATPGIVERSIYGDGAGETGSVLDGIQMVEPDIGGSGIGDDTEMAWDMVDEVEIIAAGASAQFYSSSGGLTNVVTKSGGNKFSGRASIYYANEHTSKIHLPEPELATLNLAKPSVPAYDANTSLAIGGPIIKDKIWFMSEFRYITSKSTGDFRPTVINGKQYDNYDRPYLSYVGFLKLSAQLAKNIRAFAMGHFSTLHVPYAYSGWDVTNEANQNQKFSRLNYSSNISWVVNSSTILDLRAGGLYIKWDGTNTKEADPDGPQFYDAWTGYTWGNKLREYKWCPKVNISLTLTRFIENFLGGDHDIKAGVEWERNRGEWGFYMKQPLWWTYYDGSPYYYRAQNNGVTDPVYGDGTLYYAAIGATHGSSSEIGITSRIGGFVQDSFSIKRLTINAGVRFDTIKGWVPGRTKGATSDPVALAIGESYFKPIYGFNPYDEVPYPTWDNAFPYGLLISPRLGLTYDLFGNAKTALKASFNHQPEAGLSPMGIFSMAYPGTWAGFTFNWWDNNNNGKPDLPGIDYYEEAYGQTPLSMVSDAYLRSIDPNIKVPYVTEFTFGIEHELVTNLQVGVRYINKDRRNVLGSVLWDETSGRYWYSYEKAPEWWIPFKTTVPAYGIFPAQELTMYFLSKDAPEQFYRMTNVPEGRIEYRSFEISFDKRLSHGWQLGGSVNFSKSTGNYPVSYASWASLGAFSDANSFVNSYGELPYSRPIVIKLYGTLNLPYGILFSFFYRHTDGQPWGRTVTVEPPAEWAEAHNAETIPYYIYVEKPGTRRNEAFDRLDVRLGKDFILGPGKLGFYADIFNLLGAYTLDVATNPGGTWRPMDQNTTEGSYTPGLMQLLGFSGFRQFKFSLFYQF
jgi:hypothetical protein